RRRLAAYQYTPRQRQPSGGEKAGVAARSARSTNVQAWAAVAQQHRAARACGAAGRLARPHHCCGCAEQTDPRLRAWDRQGRIGLRTKFARRGTRGTRNPTVGSKFKSESVGVEDYQATRESGAFALSAADARNREVQARNA